MENKLQLVDMHSWIGSFNHIIFKCGVEKIDTEIKRLILEGYGNRRFLGLVNQMGDLYGVIAFSLVTTSLIQTDKNSSESFSVLYINTLAVQENYQKNGYGEQLLLTALRMALTIHVLVPIKGVSLDSVLDAIEFYEKYRFEEVNPYVIGMRPRRMHISMAKLEQTALYPYSDIFNLD